LTGRKKYGVIRLLQKDLGATKVLTKNSQKKFQLFQNLHDNNLFLPVCLRTYMAFRASKKPATKAATRTTKKTIEETPVETASPVVPVVSEPAPAPSAASLSVDDFIGAPRDQETPVPSFVAPKPEARPLPTRAPSQPSSPFKIWGLSDEANICLRSVSSLFVS
jgi:hypothetical protein